MVGARGQIWRTAATVVLFHRGKEKERRKWRDFLVAEFFIFLEKYPNIS